MFDYFNLLYEVKWCYDVVVLCIGLSQSKLTHVVSPGDFRNQKKINFKILYMVHNIFLLFFLKKKLKYFC